MLSHIAGARLEGDALWPRPPFAPWWIVNRIMAADAPQTMNDEERAVVIAMIDTGARPSEIINLRRRHIVPDATPAYPRAAGRARPENSVLPPRHPNDQNLARGDAAFPDGFPHHRNKGGILSAAVNAYFSDHGLRETEHHTLYSPRHGFKDRLRSVENAGQARGQADGP